MKSGIVYVEPQMEIIRLGEADVIVTSGGMEEGGTLGGDYSPSVPLG